MFDIGLAVVDDLEVCAPHDFFLGQLLGHPFEDFLAGDVVAVHDAADAHLQRGGDDDDTIHQPADARLVHDGALKPLEAALLEVAEDSWVDDVIDGLGVGLGGEQELSHCSLVELSLGGIGVRTYEGGELATDVGRGADETLGGTVAVVDRDASPLELSAHIALAAAYSACYAYPHSVSDSIR